jgi:hypothetical protein
VETWRTHQFRLERDAAGGVRLWLDLLLFDSVIRDCLSSHERELAQWRVHRRAANDDAGHEFAFLCYASEATHATMADLIASHAAVALLRETGTLRELRVKNDGTAVEATSDANWPPPLQQAWPHYISGVSRMALDLIDRVRSAPRPALDRVSFKDCEAYYTETESALDAIWTEWGSHAFFHHINAVFGYKPVVARPASVDGMLVRF